MAIIISKLMARIGHKAPSLAWLKTVNVGTLKADFFAGLTGAIIVLPQGVAYAMIAGLPPEYGLYTAIVPAMIAALFGSSHHLISGPTAALSVIVFTTVSQFATPSTSMYLQMVLTLTLCAGLLQLLMGLLRFGAVVNFVSHSVVLGFTAGAAVVITAGQLKHLFGLDVASAQTAFGDLWAVANAIDGLNIGTSLVGLLTILCCVLVKWYSSKLPNMLIAMILAMALAYGMNLQGNAITLVGEVSTGLPGFVLPSLSVSDIQLMSSGILAVALLGLVEAISIARSVALRSKQRIDSNQEFIGQGLSNIVGACFQCYMSSGSFTRSGVNYTSGAKTPLSAVFAALLLMLIMLLLADYAAYIPVAGMAGVLLVVAYNLIDFQHIKDIVNHDKKEASVFFVTFIAAIVLHLELSIYVGVALSLFFYLRKTSRPVVDYLDGDALGLSKEAASITQVVRINGSIFFGSVAHLHSELESIKRPRVVILGRGINFIDHLGAQMLSEQASRSERTLYFCRFKEGPRNSLLKDGLEDSIAPEHFYSGLSDWIADNSNCRINLPT